jgi:Ni/Fe-hydrogenase 1 B-type cytochrome subunit
MRQPQLRRDVVYVWEIPVRVTHWVNAIAIFALSASGLYIAWPFLNGGGFAMRWAYAAHIVFGCIFVSSVMFRVYWSLRGNRWSSYRAFFPILTPEGRRGMRHAFLYYVFLRRVLPGGVGHNALAATTYTLVFTLFIVEIVTGFAMLTFNWGGGWQTAFGWVFALAAPQRIHLVHYIVMWMLLGFIVHHIYSATLFDIEAREGEISSIISGYKTVRRHGGRMR